MASARQSAAHREPPGAHGPESPREGPIGVLAIQGSFPLHLEALRKLGVEGRPVRKPEDLDGLRGIILPGGESTVMALLMEKYGLFEPLREMGRRGLPIFGTCAGAILLGRGDHPPPRLELAPVWTLRNAYGTQVDSFTATLRLRPFDEPFHGIFIRAPKLRCMGSLDGWVRDASARDASPAAAGISTAADPAGNSPPAARILGWHEEDPVLIEAGNLLLATFHPELTDDLRVHRYFLERVVQKHRAQDPPRVVARY